MKSIIKFYTAVLLCMVCGYTASASSHREAPLISNDPLADNTDLYAFRSPCDSSKIVLIADYIPFELPNGGPNYYNFGENIRYEIHVDNNTETKGDDIIYRFTFTKTNEDPTTFFNIRLGKQNLKTTYTCERSTDGGQTFTAIITNGVVPPNNIGPRSIDNATVGLGAGNYDNLMNKAVTTASSGETVFCGPIDDPFFVDLGGAFDVGGFRQTGRDGLAKYNCHAICIEVPISTLQKDGKTAAQASSILDGDFVIGVYASASRQSMLTLDTSSATYSASGDWVQVSRLGMPLTNEAVIPIGYKDKWNATYPSGDLQFASYFENPELALYMDDSQFGKAVPGLSKLRIQSKSLGSYDFRNGHEGLYSLKGNPALKGTALDPATYGNILLPDNHSPRAVDILPIFYTGVPNLAPYQLATGKPAGNPLAPGKPFINNFLPTLGDYLRLNMAVPVTPRRDSLGNPNPKFSSEGIIEAAVLGLTDTMYNKTTALQFIPNMDGFPNGRRLEDDVTTIELQAVGGVALAAIGLWYDDYVSGGSPLTPDLLNVVTFNAGVTHNDTTFKWCFPYVQAPWRGFTGDQYSGPQSNVLPVHFESFTATKVAQTVSLQWQVSDEVNSDHYNVEYSTDGINYSTLSKVTSHNANNSSYRYLHTSPSMTKINYYRITQVGKDGRTITSQVQAIRFESNSIITITPNPASNFVTVVSTIANLRITMYDNGGKKIMAQVVKDNTATINIASLARGVYTIVASDNNGKKIEVKKIVKE